MFSLLKSIATGQNPIRYLAKLNIIMYNYHSTLDQIIGVNVLSTVLKHHSLFREEARNTYSDSIALVLSRNDISNDDDIENLFYYINEGNAPVIQIDLSNNPITDSGALKIAACLEENHTILAINLQQEYPTINYETLRKIENLIMRNRAEGEKALLKCSECIRKGDIPIEEEFQKAYRFAQSISILEDIHSISRFKDIGNEPRNCESIAELKCDVELILQYSGTRMDNISDLKTQKGDIKQFIDELLENINACIDEIVVGNSKQLEIETIYSHAPSIGILLLILEHYPNLFMYQELPPMRSFIINSPIIFSEQILKLGYLFRQPHLSGLTSLDLGQTGTDCMKILLPALSNSLPQLTALDISENHMSHKMAYSALAEILKDQKSLTKLSADKSSIGDEGTAKVAAALKRNTTLKELSLAENNISYVGALALQRALIGNTTLEHLTLNLNTIPENGVAALSIALLSNTSLISLELDHCQLDDKSAKHLAVAVQGNKSLKVLSLRSNKITASGATALANSLLTNTTLEALELSDNENIKEGAGSFAKVITSNSRLRELNLQGCAVDDNCNKMLLDSLQRNTALKTLSISINMMNLTKLYTCISTILNQNYTITRINLGSYHTIVVPHEFRKKLERNKLIEKVSECHQQAINCVVTIKTLWESQAPAHQLLSDYCLTEESSYHKSCIAVIHYYGTAVAGMVSKSLIKGEYQPLGCNLPIPTEIISNIFSRLDIPPIAIEMKKKREALEEEGALKQEEAEQNSKEDTAKRHREDDVLNQNEAGKKSKEPATKRQRLESPQATITGAAQAAQGYSLSTAGIAQQSTSQGMFK